MTYHQGMGNQVDDLIDWFKGTPTSTAVQTVAAAAAAAASKTKRVGVLLFELIAHDTIAVPLDAPTLKVFEGIQRALNRLLARIHKPLLGVDGRIGPGTVRALVTVRAGFPNLVLAATLPWSSPALLAQGAAQALSSLQSLATSVGAPASVPDPATASPPSIVDATGQVVNPPVAAMVAGGGWSFSNPIVIAAAVVGGALLLRRAKGGRGRRRGRR